MSILNYPNILTNGSISSASKLNTNFDVVKTVLNGYVDQSNISYASNLTFANINTNRINTNTIQSADSIVIKLPSTNGAHSFRIKNSSGVDLIRVKSDGKVILDKSLIIYFQLAIGSILMYKGTGIANAATRSTDIGAVAGDSIILGGWRVCNGNGGTINLLNKFLYGDSVSGNVGGSNNAQVRLHSHTMSSGNSSATHTHETAGGTTSSTQPNHKHRFETDDGVLGGDGDWRVINGNGTLASVSGQLSTMNPTHNHTLSGTTGNNSATHTHSIAINNYSASGSKKNMPLCYSVIFIQKVA